MSAGAALDHLLKHLPQFHPKSEKINIESALDRYLAKTITSTEAVPSFSRSTMDGFAVRAADTFGASESNPAYLEIRGRVVMGRAADVRISAGAAAHIPTGGMLPEGADAVVMVEYTAIAGGSALEISRAVAPGENVVKKGEDLQENQTILQAGHRLAPSDLGALAAIGITEIEVFQPITVGILSTGDEVIEANEAPRPGQIRDVNYYVLLGMVQRSGAKPVRLGICGDKVNLLSKALKQALDECQIILITGGTSVGMADLTPEVINSLGKPGVLIHGLAIKPGKPAIIAVVDRTPIFGLPGHPLGAIDVFDQIVNPLIHHMNESASNRLQNLRLRARLNRSLSSVAGREDRVRVKLKHDEGELLADPVMGRSGLISLMLNADAIGIIPFEVEGLEKGDEIEVELL